MLDGILWGGLHWGPTITYYFAHEDEFTGFDTNWSTVEQTAYRAALQAWSNVANIQFVETSDPNAATFIAHSVADAYFAPDDGVLGEHQVPGGAKANGYFNFQGHGWDWDNPNGGLQIGGYGYLTIVHEIGHGLGLAHPHDNGGGSSIWPGVSGPFNDYGDNALNQSVYTVMSYNRGWAQVQDPEILGITTYGYNAGPSAFDIAAVQFLYGANTSYHTGNDVYVLPDVNAAGTFWTCIWDAGGFDEIAYNGTRNVHIDLTAATLDNSPTGGGVLSYADGVFGGFTIANGVVIEVARAGSGNDTLTGNAADNNLYGGLGNDLLFGLDGNDGVVAALGNDTARGGNGRDAVHGGQGDDLVYGDAGDDVLVHGNIGTDTVFGGTGNDTVLGGQGSDILFGEGGNDLMLGDLGADILIGGAGNDTFWFHPGRSPASVPDIVDDFDLNGDDLLVLGGAATATNFLNTGGSSATLGDAFGVADTWMDGIIIYVVINVQSGIGFPTSTNALVYWDTDLDGDPDEAIALTNTPLGLIGLDDIA
jgi:Ca2+-binding RTX toxin-like protein